MTKSPKEIVEGLKEVLARYGENPPPALSVEAERIQAAIDYIEGLRWRPISEAPKNHSIRILTEAKCGHTGAQKIILARWAEFHQAWVDIAVSYTHLTLPTIYSV